MIPPHATLNSYRDHGLDAACLYDRGSGPRAPAKPPPNTSYRVSMLTHRFQLLLDEEQYERLRAVAEQRKTSVAAVVRDCIERGLPAASPRRVAAGNRILAAEPAPVGDVEELAAELNELRGRRA